VGNTKPRWAFSARPKAHPTTLPPSVLMPNKQSPSLVSPEAWPARPAQAQGELFFSFSHAPLSPPPNGQPHTAATVLAARSRRHRTRQAMAMGSSADHRRPPSPGAAGMRQSRLAPPRYPPSPLGSFCNNPPRLRSRAVPLGSLTSPVTRPCPRASFCPMLSSSSDFGC
jgi:hypothetical protein